MLSASLRLDRIESQSYTVSRRFLPVFAKNRAFIHPYISYVASFSAE